MKFETVMFLAAFTAKDDWLNIVSHSSGLGLVLGWGFFKLSANDSLKLGIFPV
jgi:hypothetical protein